MNKEIRKKGIKEYKELFSDEPNKFEIYWYGYNLYKYFWGFVLGLLLGLLLGLFI